MKELRPLIPTASSPVPQRAGESQVGAAVTTPAPALQTKERKTVVLDAPGSNTASQSASRAPDPAWPFGSAEKGSETPQNASLPPQAPPPLVKIVKNAAISGNNGAPTLTPIAKPGASSAAPKLEPLSRTPAPVATPTPSPVATPVPSPVAEAPAAPVAPAVPELQVIRKGATQPLTEIPAMMPVVRRDETYVVFGVDASGEVEFKGVHTKARIMEFKASSFHEQVQLFLMDMIGKQTGNRGWIERNKQGYCSPSFRRPEEPNIHGAVAVLSLIDNGANLGNAAWQDENAPDAFDTYKLVMIKTEMNKDQVTIPVALI